VHEAINRADPIVITRSMALRRGQVTVYAGDYEQAAGILDSCDRGQVLMLRQPEHAGMDMYFIAEKTAVAVARAEGANTLWSVAIDYVEVTRPTADIAGALGWTFAALAASAPDFWTLTHRYASFEDMRLDQRIS
jgi:hypothetical protein